MKKAYLNWSSGKDSAYTLFELQRSNSLLVEKLVTTVNSQTNRVSMHGLRKELLLQQVKNIRLPLHIISLQGNVSMSSYNEVMQKEIDLLVQEGFTHSVFGDIFLEDLREYREQQLHKMSVQPVFPLWKRDTSELMTGFLSSGFKAIVVSVNARVLDKSFCGRIIDKNFLSDLPSNVDPAGENGEFHTFVFDGPIFNNPVTFRKGEIVSRLYASAKTKKKDCFKKEPETWDSLFYYCDLM